MSAPDAIEGDLPDARVATMRAAAAPRATRCADCGELAAYWDSDARAYQCADHAKAPTALHLDDATSVLLLADEVFRTRGLLRYAETLLGGADRIAAAARAEVDRANAARDGALSLLGSALGEVRMAVERMGGDVARPLHELPGHLAALVDAVLLRGELRDGIEATTKAALDHVAENPHWPRERRVRATRLREALENIV